MAKPKKWNEMSAAKQATENEARTAAKATRMAAEKAALHAERRITQGAGPQAERRAAAAAQAVVAPAALTGMPKMQVGDLFQSVSRASSPMTAADIGLQTGPLSVKQRIGRALGNAAKGVTKWSGTAMGKGFKAVGKSAIGPIIDPIRGFRARSAARAAAWEEAGIMGKAAQAVTTSAELGWAGAKTAGGLARGVAYGIAVDMGHEFAGHYGEVKAEREIEAERRAEYGEKYGLKVTTAPPTLLRMETGGSPKIKVEEVDKSLRAKKLAQGQSKFDERAYYNALKKVASRNVSKGSSQN